MHIVDKSFTRVVFDPNGPVKIAVIYDRKEALHMRCYRSGGCGPYEMYSCNECPASKPGYLKTDNALPPVLCNSGSNAIHHHYFGCPVCGSEVGGFVITGSGDDDWITHQDKFCRECGQRIDWGKVKWETIYRH